MKKVFLILALLFSAAVVAEAQVVTKSDTIYISAGTSHNENILAVDSGSPTVSVNYIRQLGSALNGNFGVDTSFTYSADRLNVTDEGRSYNNTTFLEYYPNVGKSRVMPFVGVGFSATRFSSKLTGGQASFNPAIEAGLDINVGDFQFEPYAQFLTPDLKQRSRTNSIGGGLNIYYNVNDNFGLRLSGSASDNRWRNSLGQRESGMTYSTTAGVFFTF